MASSGINRELLTLALPEVAFKTSPDNAKNSSFPRPVLDCIPGVWMCVYPSCLGCIIDEIAANLTQYGSFSTPQITNSILRTVALAESVCDLARLSVLVVKHQGQCATSALRNAGELKPQTGASIVCGIPFMVVFVEFPSLICSLLPQQRTPPKNRDPCRVRSQIHHVVYLYNSLRRKPRALGNEQEAKWLRTWPLSPDSEQTVCPNRYTPVSRSASPTCPANRGSAPVLSPIRSMSTPSLSSSETCRFASGVRDG